MKIETKFNMGEQVSFIHENELYDGTINRIIVDVFVVEAESSGETSVKITYNYSIVYEVGVIYENGDGEQVIVPEKFLKIKHKPKRLKIN